MNNKHYQTVFSTLVIVSVVFLGFVVVNAATSADITFPIVELGNCESKEACREYCSDEANHESCRQFAQVRGLSKRARINTALSENPGPGGCTSIASCREYCGAEEHKEECRAFGLRHGLLPEQASDRAHRVQSILIEGGPGGCSTPGECKQFCADPEHREECVEFAKEHNLLPIDAIKKFEEVRDRIKERIEGRTGPGGCTTKDECRLYCEDPTHAEECLNFGEQHNLLPREKVRAELERIKQGGFEEYRKKFEDRRAEFEARLREKRLQLSPERVMEQKEELRTNMMERKREFLEENAQIRRELEGRMKEGQLRRELEERGKLDFSSAILRMLFPVLF